MIFNKTTQMPWELKQCFVDLNIFLTQITWGGIIGVNRETKHNRNKSKGRFGETACTKPLYFVSSLPGLGCPL